MDGFGRMLHVHVRMDVCMYGCMDVKDDEMSDIRVRVCVCMLYMRMLCVYVCYVCMHVCMYVCM